MKRRVPKDLTPVIVGLLVVVVGSMMWNMQESFVSRRREGLANSKSCKSNKECAANQNCKNGACV